MKWSVGLLSVFLIIGLIVVCPQRSDANVLGLGAFDKEESYDIYCGGDSNDPLYAFKRTKIVRIEKINGLDFLVFISSAGFNSKSKEGFVLFSSVRAIVPSDTFSLGVTERIKIK